MNKGLEKNKNMIHEALAPPCEKNSECDTITPAVSSHNEAQCTYERGKQYERPFNSACLGRIMR